MTISGTSIAETTFLHFHCRNQNEVMSILTETHINHDQMHHIRNNWLGSNLFCLGDRHTKRCMPCFIWDWKVDTDPKGRFVSLNFTPSNDRVLCIYAPSRYSARISWIGDVSLKDYTFFIRKMFIRK